jgi:hypothetical protein
MDKCPRVLSRAHIRGLIARGQLIVISDKQVLRLDKWIDRHPGGRLPVLHMVGRDATDQILVLSLPPSNEDSLEEMSLSVNLLIEYLCTVTMLPRL